jgi:phytoene synthase
MTAAPPITRQEADALCLRLASRHYENFAVASLIVPRPLRVHLARIYAFCRTTDDLGDESGDAALWRLGMWQSEVEAMFDGKAPLDPVLIALRETVERFALPPEPFLDLIAANVQDQRVTAYPTWEALRAYCMLSAAPVGRMVLRVFEIADPGAVPLSDQDVAVDRGKGRTYLVGAELEERGLPGAVEAMCDRALDLLASGRRLEELAMPHRLRLQLSLYRRGGEAIIDAIRREGYRTDLRRPEVSTPTKLRLVAGALGTGVREGRGRPDAGSLTLAAAERHCQRMARREAANFYWGFIALPRPQRIAIYSLYDFARQVDDAADGVRGVSGNGHTAEREPLDLGGRQRFGPGFPGAGPDGAAPRSAAQRAELERQRERVRAALSGGSATVADPVMLVLSRAAQRFAIPLGELEELVSGVGMDLTTASYAAWEELRVYCHLVAGVVGRMCVRIFGFDAPEALERADSLGIALQLINILRDVREDAGMGRIYLPHEDLARFGISEESLLRGSPDGDWAALVAYEAARARRLYASGIEVCRYIPAQARACVRTMAGIYRGILERIEVDPELPLRERVRLSSGEKAGVMVRAWVAATATGMRP